MQKQKLMFGENYNCIRFLGKLQIRLFSYLHDDVESKVHQQVDHEDCQQVRCKVCGLHNYPIDGAVNRHTDYINTVHTERAGRHSGVDVKLLASH